MAKACEACLPGKTLLSRPRAVVSNRPVASPSSKLFFRKKIMINIKLLFWILFYLAVIASNVLPGTTRRASSVVSPRGASTGTFIKT